MYQIHLSIFFCNIESQDDEKKTGPVIFFYAVGKISQCCLDTNDNYVKSVILNT